MIEDGGENVENGEEECDEDGVVTNIDEPTPFFTKPIATIPGVSECMHLHVYNIPTYSTQFLSKIYYHFVQVAVVLRTTISSTTDSRC